MSCRCQYIKSSSKTNLGSLKAHVDKLDVDKLETLSVNLNKLSHVVDNHVFKTLYDNFVATANAFDTKIPSNSKILSQRQCNLEKMYIAKKLKVLIRRYLMLVCSQKN